MSGYAKQFFSIREGHAQPYQVGLFHLAIDVAVEVIVCVVKAGHKLFVFSTRFIGHRSKDLIIQALF